MPAEIINSVRQHISSLQLDCEINAYDFRRGYIAENCVPLLDALKRAHKEITGDKLDLASPRMISMWRDANAFNEAGITALGYGPPTQEGMGAGLAGAMRPISVDDLMATTKVIAITALDICGVADLEATWLRPE